MKYFAMLRLNHVEPSTSKWSQQASLNWEHAELPCAAVWELKPARALCKEIMWYIHGVPSPLTESMAGTVAIIKYFW